MGLDQYAYVAAKAGQREAFWRNAELTDDANNRWENPNVAEPKELAYWRKHPNLHGWMENLWNSKGRPSAEGGDPMFNGVELELTWDDITQLEKDLLEGNIANLHTTGFFFGGASDDYYREQDLEFIANAKVSLFLGQRVFYNSSW